MSGLPTTMSLVSELFRGVVDKGGKPYAGHCFRVAIALPDWVSDDARHAALLHDVIEDTSLDGRDLRNLGYSERCVWLVERLSRTPADGSYLHWIENLAASGDAELIAIKLADNKDNSAPERIAQLPPDQQSIAKRYEKARAILETALKAALETKDQPK